MCNTREQLWAFMCSDSSAPSSLFTCFRMHLLIHLLESCIVPSEWLPSAQNPRCHLSPSLSSDRHIRPPAPPKASPVLPEVLPSQQSHVCPHMLSIPLPFKAPVQNAGSSPVIAVLCTFLLRVGPALSVRNATWLLLQFSCLSQIL